ARAELRYLKGYGLQTSFLAQLHDAPAAVVPIKCRVGVIMDFAIVIFQPSHSLYLKPVGRTAADQRGVMVLVDSAENVKTARSQSPMDFPEMHLGIGNVLVDPAGNHYIEPIAGQGKGA